MPMPFAVWQQEMAKFPDLASAEDWRVRSRIEVEGLPNPWENNPQAPPPISQAPMQQELPPLAQMTPQPVAPQQAPRAAGPAMPQNNSDLWGMWTQAYRQSEELDREAAAHRRQQFEQGAQRLQRRDFGPSRSERLLALSAALLSPTAVPGIKGTLMNVAPTLAQLSIARRQSGAAREDALAKLQSDYLSGDFEARRKGLDTRRGFLKDAADLVKPKGQPVWSETLQRWIPRDERVAVDTGVLDGKPITKYSDGTYEIETPGGVEVYGPDGKKISQRGGM